MLVNLDHDLGKIRDIIYGRVCFIPLDILYIQSLILVTTPLDAKNKFSLKINRLVNKNKGSS